MRTGKFDEYIRNGQAFKEPWAFFDGTFLWDGEPGYAIERGLDSGPSYLVYFEGKAGSPITLYGSEGTFVPYQQELPLEGLDNG